MLWDTGWPQTTFKSWKPWPPPETTTKFTEALQQNKLLLQSNYQVLQYWTHFYIEKYVNSASVLQWSISVCIALHCVALHCIAFAIVCVGALLALCGNLFSPPSWAGESSAAFTNTNVNVNTDVHINANTETVLVVTCSPAERGPGWVVESRALTSQIFVFSSLFTLLNFYPRGACWRELCLNMSN